MSTEQTAQKGNKQERLRNKIAVVFGAGSVGPGWGNGKATAVLYARNGAVVVAVDINEEAARETAEIIESEGGQVVAIRSDVTQSEDVNSVIAMVVQNFKRIDILHNNVGFGRMGGPLELAESDWQEAIDVNLTGMFLTCKAALPVMLQQRSGVIINISSIAAIRYTGYNYISYYAAKGAVNQFTVGLALQYASQGIRVNAIMPGLMDTPNVYKHVSSQYSSVEEMRRARNAMCPTGRMGTAWDVANAAVFLACDDANYITGVCLPVDGGLTCRVG